MWTWANSMDCYSRIDPVSNQKLPENCSRIYKNEEEIISLRSMSRINDLKTLVRNNLKRVELEKERDRDRNRRQM
jgi:hypothetical protein